MKIGILSAVPDSYSNRRMIYEGQQRGHEIGIINYLKCYLHVSKEKCSIYYEGKELDNLDVVIPRVGTSHTFFGTAVVRQFEIMKTFSINGSLGITRSRDKLRSLQSLARSGFTIPTTGSSHATNDV